MQCYLEFYLDDYKGSPIFGIDLSHAPALMVGQRVTLSASRKGYENVYRPDVEFPEQTFEIVEIQQGFQKRYGESFSANETHWIQVKVKQVE